MKALFVGLGSIGTRHLQNLWGLCNARGLPLQVTALRPASRPMPQAAAPLVGRQAEALDSGERFDLAFITNPTHLHAEALQKLQGRVGTFFIEKPLFDSPAHSLDALGLGPTQKAYVAAPMRWCGVYQKFKTILKEHFVYSVRAICSSYLPTWRPAADYRNSYSAHRNMGGGVCLDLIHEWDYLIDLFGLPLQTAGLHGQYSNLEIDSDDLAVYIARYPKFLCELHLDYFGHSYRRTVEVFTESGTLIANFGSGALTLPDGSAIDCAEPANRRYEREMEYFVQYALEESGESINSPQKALQTLKTALGEQ